MEGCVFCKIVAGEIPAHKVFENKKILAFLDINPVNEGHVLVIPKEHYRWMYDVPDSLLAEVFVESKKIMKKLKEVMNADFVASSVVGLDAPHFHVHLIPRYHTDGLKNFWPTKKYSEGKDRIVAEKLRKVLN